MSRAFMYVNIFWVVMPSYAIISAWGAGNSILKNDRLNICGIGGDRKDGHKNLGEKLI